jgi:hypothetical protein
MKYVAVIVIIILFSRIDVLLNYFDKASEKLAGDPPEIDVTTIELKRDVISVMEDVNLKRNPKMTLMILMEDFLVFPTSETREKAILILKENPTLISDKLDKDIESRVFMWRDLLTNNNPEMINFVLDLMKIFRGENLDMLNRFLALWMDINMEHFIASYTKTKDTNCSIAVTFGDPIPEEEKLNEYFDREEALKLIVAKENLDPAQKALASNCLLQIGLMIAKLGPSPSPSPSPVLNPSSENSEQAESTP